MYNIDLDDVLKDVTAKALQAKNDGHIDTIGYGIVANCLQALYFAGVAERRDEGVEDFDDIIREFEEVVDQLEAIVNG